jgi:hypothetical protein
MSAMILPRALNRSYDIVLAWPVQARPVANRGTIMVPAGV